MKLSPLYNIIYKYDEDLCSFDLLQSNRYFKVDLRELFPQFPRAYFAGTGTWFDNKNFKEVTL